MVIIDYTLFAATNVVTLSTTEVTAFTGNVPAGAILTTTVTVTFKENQKLTATASSADDASIASTSAGGAFLSGGITVNASTGLITVVSL
ncbi:MAG: hypothetical protein Ta2G_07890 [Termitinemataceae bacterium]|nr:MAG: hypothetical protein Ta2G_07890 [Termitinemataceae bacterium]